MKLYLTLAVGLITLAVGLMGLVGCSTNNQEPTFGSIVRSRDESGFYTMRTDVNIEDWGTLICDALKTQGIEQVLFNIPPEFTEYAWGLIVGVAIKDRC
jgi:hypothetical protein